MSFGTGSRGRQPIMWKNKMIMSCRRKNFGNWQEEATDFNRWVGNMCDFSFFFSDADVSCCEP